MTMFYLELKAFKSRKRVSKATYNLFVNDESHKMKSVIIGLSNIHVKMRSQVKVQGLASIPASKKCGSGSDPRVHNMQLRD